MASNRAFGDRFPYAEPYENQPAVMAAIAEALEDERDVVFEGACGTGKTVAALLPALEYAERADRTVVISTNVHQQTRQFVEEARAIAATDDLRAVVFRGKGSMCHLDVGYDECQVLRDTTRELVDHRRDRQELAHRESELLQAARDGDEDAMAAREAVLEELESIEETLETLESASLCEYYRENLEANTARFEEWLHDGVRTPEEIYEYAETQGWCGYELVKEAVAAVDLVICNYHHLLDPGIRDHFLRWLDREPGEIVAILDEAHNVESVAREHATRQVTERTLEGALEELRETDDPRAECAINVVGAFRDALVSVYEEALSRSERRGLGEEWTDIGVAHEDRRDDLTLAFLEAYSGPGYDRDLDRARALGTALEEEYERAYREGETDTRQDCPTLTVASFLGTYLTDTGDSSYPLVSVRSEDASAAVVGRAERYACLPSEITEPLFDALGGTVLMSATLRPFDVLSETLGLEDPVELAYGMTYPPENRRTYAVDTPPLFARKREDPTTQATLERGLRDAIEYTPGNVLCFFPSYDEAARYYDRLADVDDEQFLDEPGVAVQDLKERFAACEKATLFTSTWGTLSEGVSFDGPAARTVVVVGVPYPSLDDRLRAVEAAYEARYGEGSGWRYAVEIPTVRKTRQAMGRVVRSPSDVGARILFDRRYTRRDMGEYGVRETFPPEARAELTDVEPDKLPFALWNFFTDHGLYDGDPPTPPRT